MKPDRATPLLGGLTAPAFMRRHWQKKPLLIRGALPDAMPGFGRRRMLALAADEEVESRCVVRAPDGSWTRRDGPFARRALPSFATPAWSLLVQGVDLHDDGAHRLLSHFSFLPAARLDDVMVSYATDGGGVGPHIDSYDVFLLQLAGSRHWRVGRVAAPRLRADVPLKMLAEFEPSHEWLLGAGDMLYVPPGWGHDGVAVGECLTASIGFRSPSAEALGIEMLERLADAARDESGGENDDADASGAEATRTSHGERLYRDRGSEATAHPGRVPRALQAFADRACERIVADRSARARALGEALSEPKPGTGFVALDAVRAPGGVRLDRRTRMLYDDRHVFINGASYRAGGHDARLMRRLADERELDATRVARLSAEALDLLGEWLAAGWCAPLESAPGQQRK